MRETLMPLRKVPHPEGRAERGVSKDERGEGRMSAYLYILRCADGSYYVGTTRGELEARIAER
jgi:hypothetical protein